MGVEKTNINRKYKSPHYYENRKGYTPDMIVLHHTAGMKVSSALNWFTYPTSKVSSNFVIDLDGTVYELVPIQHGAWCNGTSTTPESSIYYGKSTSPIVKSRNYNANFYTVSIECVGTGGKYTQAQVDTLVELLKYIRAQIQQIYNKTIIFDRQHIIGHYEISTIDKAMCGKGVQYDEIIAKANSKGYVPVSELKKIYRVQVGAFSVKANADKYAQGLKNGGYKAFIINDGKTYRVQVGAFTDRSNAVRMADELKGKGYKTIITEGAK